LILVAVLIGGFGSAVTSVEARHLPWLSVFGILLTVISIAFSLLDRRNRQLVENGENSLKYLDLLEGLERPQVERKQAGGQRTETISVPHPLELFARDDDMKETSPAFPRWNAYVGYGGIFKMLFAIFGLLGIVGTVVCLSWPMECRFG
jgi:hypothetical protein